ncbi:MAG: hypothetical protein M1827_002138 [Pycnora praestabilis]|nr:MAG: hypothetical protein M1827_002138 [Pycnora praestabilis]
MRSPLCITASFVTVAFADNYTNPTSTYQSRPDLAAPALNISLNEASLVSPGYIFLAPYQISQSGPYIYDNGGNLVWSGFGVSGAANAHDFYVCDYHGSSNLCFFSGNQLEGYARGHGVVMDSTYKTITSVQSGGGQGPSDQHEFKVINDGESALVTIYTAVHYDLSAYNITGGQGWIEEGVFQDINITNGDVLFEWKSLDHVDPSASLVALNSTMVSGNGLTASTAWDYFHINAVDKNAEGDYLVSSRHTSCVYKISSVDGSVTWRLGGIDSTFTLEGFNFSSQHDARFVSENSTMIVISLFDNASDGTNTTAAYSSGMVIAIDNATNTAKLINQYIAPDGGLLSTSQGNTQILPNTNVFLGWGDNDNITEHTADGTPVFAATFAFTGALQYRSFKFNWTATPIDTPALYTYAKTTSASTVFYVSWNGATEVDIWRFYTSNSTTGSFNVLANTTKLGFETIYTAPAYQAWAFVEGVTANGTSLANSSLVGTFSPGPALVGQCGDTQCLMATGYGTAEAIKASKAGKSVLCEFWNLAVAALSLCFAVIC